MKKRKSLIFAALIVAVVFAFALIACDPAPDPDPTPAPERYSVTLTFDATQGEAVLTPTSADGKYDKDADVTVTVTPKKTYELSSIKINDVAVAFTGNSYTFKVTGDTTVKVDFVQLTPEEIALDSLRGSIVFEGIRTEHDYIYESEYETEFKTTFDAEKRAVLIESYEGAEPTRYWLFREGDDGKTVQLSHDMNGALLEDDYDFEFSKLFNPFESIFPEDLVSVDENTWTIEDVDKLTAICDAIFGYPDVVESFVMHAVDGEIVSIDLAFERFTDMDWYEDYQYTFAFEVKEHGTASIDEVHFADYERTAEHEQLKAALEKAAAATSYTATLTDGENVMDVYYTADGIYIDDKGEGEKFGYVARPDGNVWSFYDEGEISFYEIVEYSSDLSVYKGVFALQDNNGEYYTILESLGNGKFATRVEDIYNSEGSVNTFIGQQLATGPEQIDLLSYGLNTCVLTIENGDIKSAEFDAGDVVYTLTFDGWNSTSLPVTISDDLLNGTIAAGYCGTWVSEDTETRLDITLDGILVGEYDEATDITETAGGYTFTAGGVNYTVTLSGGKLTLTPAEGDAITLYICPWLDYVGTFIGVDNGDDVDVYITVTEISVKFGEAAPVKAVGIVAEKVYVLDDYGYPDLVDQFTFTLGDKTYVLQQYTGYDHDRLVLAEENDTVGVGLTRDRYEELGDWSEHNGTYSGEGYKAVIASDKITITHDGTDTEITEGIVYYRDWNYQTGDYYYQLTFTYGGKKCLFEVIDNAMLFVVGADNTATAQTYYLMDESYTIDYTPYIGVYTGTSATATATVYTIEIKADGVYIKIDEGTSNKAETVYFEDTGYSADITLKLNGAEYYMRVYSEAYSFISPTFYVDGEYVYLQKPQDGTGE